MEDNNVHFITISKAVSPPYSGTLPAMFLVYFNTFIHNMWACGPYTYPLRNNNIIYSLLRLKHRSR